MRTRNPLVGWDAAVTAFLISRRALGRAYGIEEWILNNLRTFLAKAGADDLDQQLFNRWREPFCRLSVDTRVARERVVYRFCRYRRRSEPGCFFPDMNSLARPRAQPLPTIIEREQIVRLLRYVSGLRPKPHETLRPAVLRLAIILLYTTGLRRGELVRLTLGDVDERQGVLFIRESKLHKSRWVPLSPSVRDELRRYLAARRRAGFDNRDGATLLCNVRGRGYTGPGFHHSLADVLVAAGIHGRSGRHPRVQDFRHSFAVAALLRWYENDADVQVNLPKLALYMGHVSIVSTAYYLRCMPAVVERASERFARSCGDLIDGGAP
ncbi:MAG: tyrosine-type recombinase/integrase [Betaproteobacteria bacterium]